MTFLGRVLGSIFSACWCIMFGDMIYQSARFKPALDLGDYCGMTLCGVGGLLMIGLIWSTP